MPFLSNIGSTEIIFISIVLLFLFGGKKVNEWAHGIGEAGKELKKAKKELETTLNDETEEVEPEKKAEEKPQKAKKSKRKSATTKDKERKEVR